MRFYFKADKKLKNEYSGNSIQEKKNLYHKTTDYQQETNTF
jgi:hypothetical protein